MSSSTQRTPALRLQQLSSHIVKKADKRNQQELIVACIFP